MGGEELMEDESGLTSDPEELATEIEKCESKVTKLQEKILQEDAKMEKYRVSKLNGSASYFRLLQHKMYTQG